MAHPAALSGTHRAMIAALLLVGCDPLPPPPPRLVAHGLPVSGSIADARAMGFTDCFQSDAASMRCRRHDVVVDGHGPYEAAVDLTGGAGEGGFDHVTLWHDRDQYAVYPLADQFEHDGWRTCSVNVDDRGDQLVYRRRGERYRVSMDLSYFGKRRLRLIPMWNRRDRMC